MTDNLNDFSKEELIESVKELQRALEDDENEIARLTQDNENLKRRKGSNKDIDEADIAEFIAEIDNLKAKQEQDSIELTKLSDQLTDSKARYSILLTEKTDLDHRVKSQSKRIEELERELLTVSSVSKSANLQSQELSKLKSESNKETLRLLQEIEKLQEKETESEIRIRELEEHKNLLEEVIQKLADEKEDLSSHKESADLTTEELKLKLNELEETIIRNEEALNISRDEVKDLQRINDSLKKEFQSKQNVLQGQLTAKSTEIVELQRKVADLAANKGKIAPSSSELAINTNVKLINDLQSELELAISEKEKLADRIIETEDTIERIVAERVANEKEKARILELSIANLKQQIVNDSQRVKEFDSEKAKLQSEIDELNHWKAVYEAGHGMQEISRNQNTLKLHNRRLELALDQMSSKLGALMDANSLISQAFDRLKAESGKDSSFMYPEYILQEDMLTEKARLLAQVKELEEQVNSLETDCIRLRKALKNQAGLAGEKNLENLRDSNVEILLENKSSELIRENHKLKDDIKLLTLQLQHYERDISIPVQAQSESSNSKELSSLRDDIQKLFNLLRAKSSNALESNAAESISSILLSHNEALMKEIREIKKTQQSVSRELGNADKIDSVPRFQVSTKSDTEQTTSSKQSAMPLKPIDDQTRISEQLQRSSSFKLLNSKPMQIQNRQGISVNKLEEPSFPIEPEAPKLVPSTLSGQALLTKNLTHLNLPPEEWANDVRNLNAQLIECLEQLFEREQEIENQKSLLQSFEDHLISVKHQTSVLYLDYTRKTAAWEKREKEYKDSNIALRNENEDNKLKLKRFNELIEVKKEGNFDVIEAKINELTKKVSIYEVNENILSRKYISQAEQLASEQSIRRKLETDLAEMESTLKKRILYLEHYKATAGSRLAFLQSKLNESVPQNDYLSLQTELEYLREEHLNSLRREVDARVLALTGQENTHELRSLRQRQIELEAEIVKSREMSSKLAYQLEHEKSLTNKVAKATNMSEVTSDMARYRGEASRLEVELAASNKRIELLTHSLEDFIAECESLKTRVRDLENAFDEATASERNARKELLEFKNSYDNGLSREDADRMRSKIEKLSKDLEDSQRENHRLKEVADISSQQAQALAHFKNDSAVHLKELQEHCSSLESRGDDDILIGKLQRQLMSTKTSYKAFVRKYQVLQNTMRNRELAIRVLESRLDQREDMIIKLQESFRIEINALKKSLHEIHNSYVDESIRLKNGNLAVKSSTASAQSLSSKLKDVSRKVSHFSNLAEKAVIRKLSKEQECQTLQGKLDEIQAEKEVLEMRCADLDAISRGKVKEASIASRIISTSEEIRTLKLSNLQQKRQIQLLRQEKKHLENVISNIESDVEKLEELNVRSELKNKLLPTVKLDEENLLIENNMTDQESATDAFFKRAWKGEDDLLPQIPNKLNENKGSDQDELMAKFQSLNNQLIEANRISSSYKIQVDELRYSLQSTQALLKEREEELSYYENAMTSEGLPVLSGAKSNVRYSLKQNKLNTEEQERLQEAATVTISSLKSLIEDKNRQIEKLREKIDELNSDRHRKKTKADLNAEDLLERLNEQNVPKSEVAVTKKEFQDEEVRIMNQKLLDQLDQADQLISEKSQTISQLEQKLLFQENQRERAEIRCGESIKEMESMKADMVRLAQQLQLSEERFKAVLPKASTITSSVIVPPASVSASPEIERRLKELVKAVKAKDDKIKGYREIIIKLKDEFIKSEEDKALILLKSGRDKKDVKLTEDNAANITTEELKQLRNQVSILRGGLQQAKEDLEKARISREKLNRARQLAVDDVTKLESQLSALQSETSLLEEAKEKFKKDLEDSRRKEVRLRDKLKEIMDSNVNGSDKEDVRAARNRIESLEREIEVLRAQNTALRGNIPLNDNDKIAEKEIDNVPIKSHLQANDKFHGTARTLGGNGPGDIDDVRQQLHAKWENEKKLQKRVATLEKRLQEQLDENESLQTQLKRTREELQSVLISKDTSKNNKTSKVQSSTIEPSKEDLIKLEQAQRHIFELENENNVLRRQLEVETFNEITSLRQQLHSARNQYDDAVAQIQEMEKRRRNESMGSYSIRDSEDRFMREEKLKDDLAYMKQQRLELEAALLERDAAAMEHKFDMASQEQELKRLRRRLSEQERTLDSMSRIERDHVATGSKTTWTTKDADLKNKREKELEFTIETMTKVIDRLKSENERIRKLSSAPSPGLEKKSDRKAVPDKKKVEELEEELKDMQAKVKNYDDVMLKLTQRQQQIASLRKQLKSKEDETVIHREKVDELVKEKEALTKKISLYDSKIQQLEISLQQASSKILLNSGAPQSTKSVSQEQSRMELELKVKVEELSLKLRERESELERLSSHPKTSVSAAEFARLEEENKKLKIELSAFDMDFFDEIENLKYEHAESLRKLRIYKRKYGDIA